LVPREARKQGARLMYAAWFRVKRESKAPA
jgi:hypothetical protein